MKCTKVKFRDEIARKDKPGHENHNRADQCPLCHKWHTTSKEHRAPDPRD